MNHRLKKNLARLLAASAISLSTLECHGAVADFSNSQLSSIWQQEFSLPARDQPPAETKTYSANTDAPHPAVVRVIVPEEGATSYGSGTLVDLRGEFGLVITNWHVVRDAKGMVEVVFPGGFKSKARSLKVDPDWDLAALVIWRPPVEPVSIASIAPQPGDLLTICGYGQGNYRAATGRCTQYYAPRLDFPRHMVELDVEARQGDSGGPIFNTQGELAGVLFGAGQGTTLGSFGGRVDSFLASLAPDIGQQPDGLLAIADPLPSNCGQACCKNGICVPREDPAPVDQRDAEPSTSQLVDHLDPPSESSGNLAAMWPEETATTEVKNPSPPTRAEVTPWQETPHRPFEQMKTVLAAIGLVSIAVLILRAAR